MTALAGTNAPTAIGHDANDHLLAPGEHGTPTSHISLGLAFGAIGALLVAVGGVGLPAALIAVEQRHLVTPDQRPALDAALRLAPVLFVAGMFHLVAAVGLLTGAGWGRRAGMILGGTIAIVGMAGMAAVAANADPFVRVTTQNAAVAGGQGLSILGFLVVAYAAAAVTLLVSRRAG